MPSTLHPDTLPDRRGGIVVQKYGGSSVADVARIHQVARRVVETRKQGHRVVVVVSAMGNTTNELLALARQVSERPGHRELDLLVSVGERVSMTLLAMAIEDLGVPAASFTGSQSGIITDESHAGARVIEVRPERIRRALDEHKVVIVAGFQGVSRAGEVTTLGRGGSDTTAVVLTAALGAAWCEICSDVDGVYSADPRVVGDARRIDELPLDAATALARAGSKVLLVDALEHARQVGITLHAASTARPPGSGTRLPPGGAPDDVVAVAADTELVWLHLASDADPVALPAGVRAWLPAADGQFVLLDVRNLHRELVPPPGVRLLGPVAAVSAIGRRAVADPAECARALAAVSSCCTPVRWWAAGETWTAVVPRESAAQAQCALHEALIAHR